MKSDYIYLNSKTFEIEENNKVIPVDEQLAKTISILNQKGYYVERFNRAKITKPFIISSLIHGLKEQQLLDINDKTKDKIKKIIKNSDYESTLIIFKENYTFNNLPHGYKLIGKDLIYNLTALKDGNDIETKELIELDDEHEESIKSLENWANNLPKIN